MKIAPNSRVKLTYVLKYDNATGDIIENIPTENALEVTIGTEDLLEKFEEKIMNLTVGDTFEFTLSPEQAYGNYDEEGVVSIPKAELMEDVEDVTISEGDIIPIVTDDEEEMEAVVLEIKDDIVTLDFNHPLAGEMLYFAGKIVSIR
ncbi:MAG: FKBP-type peptidyl-prolyl cis-trans isomerase [Bacteroidales bacterium]|jgi:FKBP-type peptidyl-prolyl cis-trans isomerase SlyD|nr:FKBP-type peptidyl-prolyl cis-trans isomerase [Bacteroidales bacterium]